MLTINIDSIVFEDVHTQELDQVVGGGAGSEQEVGVTSTAGVIKANPEVNSKRY